jgi:hypothetical protein
MELLGSFLWQICVLESSLDGLDHELVRLQRLLWCREGVLEIANPYDDRYQLASHFNCMVYINEVEVSRRDMRTVFSWSSEKLPRKLNGS